MNCIKMRACSTIGSATPWAVSEEGDTSALQAEKDGALPSRSTVRKGNMAVFPDLI